MHTHRDTHTHAHACSYKAVADITGHQGTVKRDHKILLRACFRPPLQDHFLREAFHSLPGRLDLPVMEAHGTGYLSIMALDTLAALHVVVGLSGVCPSPDCQPHDGRHDVCSAHRVLRAWNKAGRGQVRVNQRRRRYHCRFIGEKTESPFASVTFFTCCISGFVSYWGVDQSSWLGH